MALAWQNLPFELNLRQAILYGHGIYIDYRQPWVPQFDFYTDTQGSGTQA